MLSRYFLLKQVHTGSVLLIIIINPLASVAVGMWQMTLQPALSSFVAFLSASGFLQVTSLSNLWCCLPINFIAWLSSSLHCSLQDGSSKALRSWHIRTISMCSFSERSMELHSGLCSLGTSIIGDVVFIWDAKDISKASHLYCLKFLLQLNCQSPCLTCAGKDGDDQAVQQLDFGADGNVAIKDRFQFCY